MSLKKLIPLTLLLCVGLSLINADVFGEPSLFSYFFYSFSSCVLTILVLFSFFSFQGFRFKITLPVLFFLLLAFYIFLHGIITHSLFLPHYYWLINAILLLSVSYWTGSLDNKQMAPFLFKGILLIAVTESIIVIMQFINILPVTNKYFSATGTWVNPNITAMFLAMSLFSYFNPDNNYRDIKKVNYSKILSGSLLIVLSAIAVLRCRSAYIVSGVFIITYCSQFFRNNLPQIAKLNRRILVALFIGLILTFSTFLSFHFKEASTNSRIQIWKNCLKLIADKPLTGVGFGQFEKEYNLFIALHNLPSNGHVYMPYNDFLELAVEGGVLTVALWVAFLVSLVIQFKKDSWGLAVVASFIIIQLTNFGFQSIPVFALFLLYMGFMQKGKLNNPLSKILIDKRKVLPIANYPVKSVALIPIICCILLCSKLFFLANAFHQTKIISQGYSPQEATDKYESLSGILYFSSSYHEKYADAFMQVKNYPLAKIEYQQALQTTSKPDVLGKCGWCYGLLGQYDSAAYFFKTIEKLEPYKFAPQVALLQLYQQQKDTIMIKQKAREIISMPVKIPSDEVNKIKEEAKRVMNNVTMIN